MEGFEYSLIDLQNFSSASNIEHKLNEYGKCGWKLREILQDSGILIMERPKTYSDSDSEDE